MGYTTGRRLTPEYVAAQAKKYESKVEFQMKDPSSYKKAKSLGIFEQVTSHMKRTSFSVPQLICRQFFDELIDFNSLYNTRKIITPYEIDIYYPSSKVAVEYHGKGWHSRTAAVQRDSYKKELLKEKGIYLIEIHEKSRRYENDIKSQICNHEELLKKLGKTRKDVMSLKINWHMIYRQTSWQERIRNIKIRAKSCSSIKEFRTKFNSDYRFLSKYRMRDMISFLPTDHDIYTDDYLIEKSKEYESYAQFCGTKYYHALHRRNLLDKVPLEKSAEWTSHSDEELIQIYHREGYTSATSCRKGNSSLYWAIRHRKLKPWPKRKPKNDPRVVRERVEKMLRSGYSMGQVKKTDNALYSSYRFNVKKGHIKPIHIAKKGNLNGKERKNSRSFEIQQI